MITILSHIYTIEAYTPLARIGVERLRFLRFCCSFVARALSSDTKTPLFTGVPRDLKTFCVGK